VGIAGGERKCRSAVEDMGFDACINHRDPALKDLLAQACRRASTSISKTSEEWCLRLSFPSEYALTHSSLRFDRTIQRPEAPQGRDRTSQVMGIFLKRRVRLQGFIIFDDYGPHFGDFQKQMSEWFTPERSNTARILWKASSMLPRPSSDCFKERTLENWWCKLALLTGKEGVSPCLWGQGSCEAHPALAMQ